MACPGNLRHNLQLSTSRRRDMDACQNSRTAGSDNQRRRGAVLPAHIQNHCEGWHSHPKERQRVLVQKKFLCAGNPRKQWTHNAPPQRSDIQERGLAQRKETRHFLHRTVAVRIRHHLRHKTRRHERSGNRADRARRTPRHPKQDLPISLVRRLRRTLGESRNKLSAKDLHRRCVRKDKREEQKDHDRDDNRQHPG